MIIASLQPQSASGVSRQGLASRPARPKGSWELCQPEAVMSSFPSVCLGKLGRPGIGAARTPTKALGDLRIKGPTVIQNLSCFLVC